MNDPIERQDAINAIKAVPDGNWSNKRYVTAIKELQSAQPEITNEEIRFSLKQLRAYLAIKIRDRKEGGVPVELLKRVEEIQKYFENVTFAQPEPCEDAVSREAVLDKAYAYGNGLEPEGYCVNVEDIQALQSVTTKRIPSAQPEQDILAWLLAYHTKSFDLNGRYMAHEVIGWIVHDFATAYMAERREG